MKTCPIELQKSRIFWCSQMKFPNWLYQSLLHIQLFIYHATQSQCAQQLRKYEILYFHNVQNNWNAFSWVWRCFPKWKQRFYMDIITLIYSITHFVCLSSLNHFLHYAEHRPFGHDYCQSPYLRLPCGNPFGETLMLLLLLLLLQLCLSLCAHLSTTFANQMLGILVVQFIPAFIVTFFIVVPVFEIGCWCDGQLGGSSGLQAGEIRWRRNRILRLD